MNSGELDGVVRVGRIAEAFYTQIEISSRTKDEFAVVPGLNHAAILNLTTLPAAVTSKDLRSLSFNRNRARLALPL